jgi:hypothetical protein
MFKMNGMGAASITHLVLVWVKKEDRVEKRSAS